MAATRLLNTLVCRQCFGAQVTWCSRPGAHSASCRRADASASRCFAAHTLCLRTEGAAVYCLAVVMAQGAWSPLPPHSTMMRRCLTLLSEHGHTHAHTQYRVQRLSVFQTVRGDFDGQMARNGDTSERARSVRLRAQWRARELRPPASGGVTHPSQRRSAPSLIASRSAQTPCIQRSITAAADARHSAWPEDASGTAASSPGGSGRQVKAAAFASALPVGSRPPPALRLDRILPTATKWRIWSNWDPPTVSPARGADRRYRWLRCDCRGATVSQTDS